MGHERETDAYEPTKIIMIRIGRLDDEYINILD